MNSNSNSAEGLYRLAAACTLAISLLTPLAIVAFVIWPPPYDAPVVDWFEVFDDNWLIGLISMDLLLTGVLILEIPVLIALFAALRLTNQWLISLAVVIGLVGIALHLSSITSVEMLSLSQEYFDPATTEAEKTQLLGAGEAMLARYEGTQFHLNYVVGGTVVPVLISTVMLQSDLFRRSVVYVGIFAAIFNLGLYIPEIGLVLSVFSGLAFLVWYVMLGLRFHALARELETTNRLAEASI